MTKSDYLYSNFIDEVLLRHKYVWISYVKTIHKKLGPRFYSQGCQLLN